MPPRWRRIQCSTFMSQGKQTDDAFYDGCGWKRLFHMIEALRAFSYGHGGLGVCLIAVAAGYFRPAAGRWGRNAETVVLSLCAAVCVSMITELFLTTWYLFSPAYLDHIE